MAEPASDQPGVAPARPANRWFSWLALFVVATGGISLAAVYLPSRVKMLGLFAIGHGLLAGWVAARLAAAFDLRGAFRPAALAAVFLVVLGGQIEMAVESHRLYRAALERDLALHPKRAAALRMLESLNLPDDLKSRQLAADARQTIDARGTSFADYLQFRVSALGVDSRFLAAGIWILEIAIGSFAGTWIFRRLAPAPRLEAPGPPAKLEE